MRACPRVLTGKEMLVDAFGIRVKSAATGVVGARPKL